jgi:hypothetical protein
MIAAQARWLRCVSKPQVDGKWNASERKWIASGLQADREWIARSLLCKLSRTSLARGAPSQGPLRCFAGMHKHCLCGRFREINATRREATSAKEYWRKLPSVWIYVRDHHRPCRVLSARCTDRSAFLVWRSAASLRGFATVRHRFLAMQGKRSLNPPRQSARCRRSPLI